MFALEKKRHENLILATSNIVITKKMIFKSRAFTKLIVDLCIISQSSEQANLLCKNKKAKKQKTKKNKHLLSLQANPKRLNTNVIHNILEIFLLIL